jgi:hypothetical protein
VRESSAGGAGDRASPRAGGRLGGAARRVPRRLVQAGTAEECAAGPIMAPSRARRRALVPRGWVPVVPRALQRVGAQLTRSPPDACSQPGSRLRPHDGAAQRPRGAAAGREARRARARARVVRVAPRRAPVALRARADAWRGCRRRRRPARAASHARLRNGCAHLLVGIPRRSEASASELPVQLRCFHDERDTTSPGNQSRLQCCW